MTKAFKMRLEYGMGEEFEAQHSEMWPEVEKMIHEHGGSDCSIFLDERTGYLFVTVKVEDEAKWNSIGDNEICRKWVEHIAHTVKTTRGNHIDATPLRMVCHVD